MPARTPARTRAARRRGSAPRTGPFSAESVIADVLTAFPAGAAALLAHGLHCVGCSASTADTIAVGARSHGLGAADVRAIVRDLNAAAARFDASLLHAGDVAMSPAARDAILRIAQEEGKRGVPLRVEVEGEACRGLTHVLDFTPPRPDDVTYDFGTVTLVAAPEHAARFRGSTIDYLDGPMGTGFRVDNPASRCTCADPSHPCA